MNSLLSQIERVPVSALGYYPGNPRVGNVPVIASSLTENAQFAPIVVQRSTGYVLAGNHTLKAAQLLGWPTIDVVYVDVDDARARKIVLASNRTAERGTYDGDALVELLSYLDGDYAGTGWTEEDVTALLAPDPDEEPSGGHGDPDRIPEPPERPISTIGDTWILGRHRLVCGDSTDVGVLEALLEGQPAAGIYTDPPYNADYSSRVDANRRKPWGGIANDNMTTEAFDAFLVDIHSAAWSVLVDQGSVYVWTDWKRYPQVARVFGEAFTHKATVIWDKGHFGLGTYYRTQYELVLFGVKGDRIGTWNAGHDERDVWSISRDPTSSYVHPTQKPVELAERAMVNSTCEGDIVLDMFGGSGSTLIAADRTGRAARLVELSPRYVDVICRRFQEYAGTRPILASTGEPVDFLVQTL